MRFGVYRTLEIDTKGMHADFKLFLSHCTSRPLGVHQLHDLPNTDNREFPRQDPLNALFVMRG